MIITRPVRLVLALVAAVDLLFFSYGDVPSLLGIAVGTAVIAMGLWYFYRPGAVMGVLIVSVVAGGSVEIPTLSELGYVLMAVIGLLVPVVGLLWLALSAEEDERQEVTIPRRPMLTAIGYLTACLWSAPLIILVLGITAPAISMRMGVMAEAGVVLITATVLGAALTLRGSEPQKAIPGRESGPSQ